MTRQRPHRSAAWSEGLLAAALTVTEQLRDRELQRLARRHAQTEPPAPADDAAPSQRPGSSGNEPGGIATASDAGAATA
jgi:hypothetical protein